MKIEIPELDVTKSISATAQEFQYNMPEWTQVATLLNSTISTAYVSAAINTAGKVYGVALPAGQPKPLAQQIALGFDSYNVKVPSGMAAASPCLYKTPTPLSFTGLTERLPYEVWVTGENSLPVTPTLMDDSRVHMVNFTAGVNTTVAKDVLVMMEDDLGTVLLWAAGVGLMVVGG